MGLRIRSFAPDDTEPLRAICCTTVADRPFLPWADDPRLACEFFLDPYLALEPASCFVAELHGNIVGYLVGTRDAKSFSLRQSVHMQQRLLRLLKMHVGATVTGRFRHFLTHYMLAKAYWNLLAARVHRRADSEYFDLERYPAHCHVQVLPEARGKCVGLALMLKFHEYLKANGVRGHHGAVVEESGRESFSQMLQALKFRFVHEKQFTAREVKTLLHPGTWKERVFVREL